MDSYFTMTGSTRGFPEHTIRRPMSDLTAVERDLDEIAARASGAATPEDLDGAASQFWGTYGKPRKPKTPKTIDRAEVEARLRK